MQANASGTEEWMSDVYSKGIKHIYRMKEIHQRGQPDVIIPGYV